MRAAALAVSVVVAAGLVAGCNRSRDDKLKVRTSVTPAVTVNGVGATSIDDVLAVAGTVLFSATVDDYSELEEFTFELDGQLVGAPIPGPGTNAPIPLELTVDTTTLADGFHTLRAIAEHENGERTRRTVKFLVDNAAPAPVSVLPIVANTQGLNGFLVTVTDEPDPQTPNSGVDADASEPEIEFTSAVSGTTVGLVAGQDYTITRTIAAGNAEVVYTINLLVAAEGLYRVSGNGTDRVANATAYDETVRADITVPLLTFEQPAGSAIVAGGNVVVRVDDVAFAALELFRLDHTGSSPFLRTAIPLGAPAQSGTTFTFTVAAADCAAVAPATEGLVQLLAQATDLAGNVSVARLDFTFDSVAPVLAYVGPTGFSNATALTAAVDVTEAQGLASLTFTADDGTATTTVALPLPSFPATAAPVQAPVALNEGVYTGTFTAVDRAGNAHSVTGSFTVDRTAPTIVENAFRPLVNGAPAAFAQTIDISDANGFATINVTAPSGTPSVPSTGTTRTISVGYPAALISDGGTFTIDVTAIDPAGNVATRTFTFVLDNVFPTITGLAPAAGAVVSDDPVFVSSSVQGAAGVTYAITGAATITQFVAGPDAVADYQLAEGVYTVVASATDANGNTTTAPASSFRVDRTAPVITLSDPAVEFSNLGTTLTDMTLDVDDASGVADFTITVTQTSGSAALRTVLTFNDFNLASLPQSLGALGVSAPVSPTTQAGDTIEVVITAQDNAVRTPNVATPVSKSFVYDDQAPQIAEGSFADGEPDVGTNRRAIFRFNEPLAVLSDADILATFEVGGIDMNAGDMATDMRGQLTDVLENDTVFVVAPVLHPAGASLEFDTATVRDRAGNAGNQVFTATVKTDTAGPELVQVEIGGTPVPVVRMFGDSPGGGMVSSFLGATIDVRAGTRTDDVTQVSSGGGILLSFDEPIARFTGFQVLDELDRDILDPENIDLESQDLLELELRFGGLEPGGRYRVTGQVFDDLGNRTDVELFLTVVRDISETSSEASSSPQITVAFAHGPWAPIYVGLSEGFTIRAMSTLRLDSLAGGVPEFRVHYEQGMKNALRLEPVGAPWPSDVTVRAELTDLDDQDENTGTTLFEVAFFDTYEFPQTFRARPAMASSAGGVAALDAHSTTPHFELGYDQPIHEPGLLTETAGANIRVFEDWRGGGTEIPILGWEAKGRQALLVGLSANGIDPLTAGATFRVAVNETAPVAAAVQAADGGGPVFSSRAYFRTASASENPLPDVQSLLYATDMLRNVESLESPGDTSLSLGELSAGIRMLIFDASDDPARFPEDPTDIAFVTWDGGRARDIIEAPLQAGFYGYDTPLEVVFFADPFDPSTPRRRVITDIPGDDRLFGISKALGLRQLEIQLDDDTGFRSTDLARRPYLFKSVPEGGSLASSGRGEVVRDEFWAFPSDTAQMRFVVFEVVRKDFCFSDVEQIVYTALATMEEGSDAVSFTLPPDLPANAGNEGGNGDGGFPFVNDRCAEYFARFRVISLDALDNVSENRSALDLDFFLFFGQEFAANASRGH